MKKTSKKRKSVTTKKSTPRSRLFTVATRPFVAVNHKIQNLKSRRPHRSFRLTRRRDYKRSLKIPGYWAFTIHVLSVLGRRWKLFVSLAILYALMGMIFGMMMNLDTYREAGGIIDEGIDGVFMNGWVSIAQASILSATLFIEGASQATDVQGVYAGLTALLVWLTTVWLLREMLAGRKPRLRDGIYNAASPLVSTTLVALYLIMQLVPLALLAIAYSALNSAGMIAQGFPLFLFMIIAALVIALSLYWITSTFIALVVVTLPGMYPVYSLKVAGDLVVGRRLRILLRLIWMVFMVVAVWLVTMVPMVMFDAWLVDSFEWGWLKWVPVVPFVALLLRAIATIWIASYIYLLYRKVVDDDAAPA